MIPPVLFLWFSFFVCVRIVTANGPEPQYEVYLPPVSCVRFVDVQNIPSDKTLVFDYDSLTGNNLKRPWKVVEEGKCYAGGGAILLPRSVTDLLGDALRTPEKHDPNLSLVSYGGPNNMYSFCGVQKEIPEVCALLFSKDGELDPRFSPLVPKNPNTNLNVILAGIPGWEFTVVKNYSSHDVEYSEIGVEETILAFSMFQSEKVWPRFAHCDARVRTAQTYRIASQADATVPDTDEIIKYAGSTWTMRDGSEVEGREDLLNPRSAYDMDTLDTETLTAFNTIGCFNEVLEIRAEVAKMADPTIDMVTYVADAKRVYLEELAKIHATTSMAQITATSKASTSFSTGGDVSEVPEQPLPQGIDAAIDLEAKESRVDMSSSKKSPIIYDESVQYYEQEHEREWFTRAAYFLVLPIVGALTLGWLFLRRRRA